MEGSDGENAKEAEVLNWNKLAMDHIRLDHFETALGLLRTAEDSLTHSPDFPKKQKLTAITFNNLGLLYKRTKRPTIALHYLRRALEVESKPPADQASLARTHLNICAIRSGLGAHEKALEHAKKAIRLLVAAEDHSHNKNSTLVIAYQNAGIEFEFLQFYREARECYALGYELARQTLGKADPLTLSLYHSCGPQGEASGLSLSVLSEARTPQRPSTRSHSSEKKQNVYSQPLPRISTAPRRKRKRNKAVFPEGMRLNVSDIPADSHPDLLIGGNIRYITGDRLKPMNKEGYLLKERRRARSKDSVQPMPPVTRPGSKSYRTRMFELRQTPGTGSAGDETPSDSRFSSVSSKLSHLQTAIRDFEAKSHSIKAAIDSSAYSDSDRSSAATMIQALIRGFLVRQKGRHPAPAGVPPHSAAVVPVAPAHAPGPVFHRKPPTHKADLTEAAAATIQRVVRSLISQEFVRRRVQAATMIQKCVRGRQCRKLYRWIHEAVVCIQAAWLRYRRRRRG